MAWVMVAGLLALPAMAAATPRPRPQRPQSPQSPQRPDTPHRPQSPPTFLPDDPGIGNRLGGWLALQWNFAATPAGVDAPTAWENLIRAGRPGGQGVIVAVLDTGVAFRDWQGFHRSPDFAGARFIAPCDLVAGVLDPNGDCTDPHALDRDGHGTFVAGMIAEATNNRIGVTGLAYGATIMPVRVLNEDGWGYPDTVAEGIRYAVAHGAQVINLSLSFALGLKASQIPTLLGALADARAQGVVVVAAAGNDDAARLSYPAAAPGVISVGASTADGCLAAYSNHGPALDLVAPGGGDDAPLPERRCRPEHNLPDVYQETFRHPGDPTRFGLPAGWFGTSMAAPEVSAAAALVIASGELGPRPTPAAVLHRLEETATQPLGPTGRRNDVYGYGILNAGAATTPLALAARDD